MSSQNTPVTPITPVPVKTAPTRLDQCALNADGTLKDASEMEWFNDPDDEHPIGAIPSMSSSATGPNAGEAKKNAFDVLGKSTAKPAVIVAGQRRSSRPHKPRIDPDNAETLHLSHKAEFQARASDALEAKLGKRVRMDNAVVKTAAVKIKRRRVVDDSEPAVDVLSLNADAETLSDGLGLEELVENPPATDDDFDMHSMPDLEEVSDSDDDDDEFQENGEGGEDEAEDDEDGECENEEDGEGEDEDEEGEDEGDDENEDPDSYANMRAHAEADREARRPKKKTEATADIRTIFLAEDKGHRCVICKKNRRSKTLFRGNVTSCRTHIARNVDHFMVYKKKCEELGIPMNSRAIPAAIKNAAKDVQTTLDVHLKETPKTRPVTRKGLMEYIIELVVVDSKALLLVEKGAFRRLVLYLAKNLKNDDIPGRTAVRTEIVSKAERVVDVIRDSMANAPGRHSFTFDIYTKHGGDPFLSLTDHRITVDPENPHSWKLECDQIGFEHVPGSHNGENIANVVVGALDRFDITADKVGWFTADNATNNDTAIKAIARVLDAEGEDFDPKERRIRCMEHTLHLAAQHFVSTSAPAPGLAILQRVHDVLDRSLSDAEAFNPDALDDELREMGFDPNSENEPIPEGEEAAVPFKATDTIGKAMALIKQIRMSPQAREFFHKTCREENVPTLELLLWVRTRWASLHKFLERICLLKKGITKFIQLADDSDEVPNLAKGKNGVIRQYSDFKLSRAEWARIDLMREVLQEPATAHETFLSESEPTLSRVIPTLECLQTTWEAMADDPKFADLAPNIQAGLENMRKWYRSTDDSVAYFASMFFDPKWKDRYARKMWDEDAFNTAMDRFGTQYDDYYNAFQDSLLARPIPSFAGTASATAAPPAPTQYGASWMAAAVDSDDENGLTTADKRLELRNYLSAPREKDATDIVAWWGLHSSTYPVLARMALDYLPIQGSASPSERAFSYSGLDDVARRNRINPVLFSALQILKGAYRNGRISASKEVAEQARKLFAAMDILEESDDE